MSRAKRYDRAYFERWYHSASAVDDDVTFLRRLRMVVAASEYLLNQPLGSVLDLGCGEARWRAPLVELRPDLHYTGVDASPYVVERFGPERNIRLGRFDDPDRWGLAGPYDLILCCDLLHYLTAREIDRGLRSLVTLLRGVAFLDVSAIEDEPEGDLEGWQPRSDDWYGERFERAGLMPRGLQLFMKEEA